MTPQDVLQRLDALQKSATVGPWWPSENDGSIWADGPDGKPVSVGEMDLNGHDEQLILEVRHLLPALVAVARAAQEVYDADMEDTRDFDTGQRCLRAMDALEAALAALEEVQP